MKGEPLTNENTCMICGTPVSCRSRTCSDACRSRLYRFRKGVSAIAAHAVTRLRGEKFWCNDRSRKRDARSQTGKCKHGQNVGSKCHDSLTGEAESCSAAVPKAVGNV